MLICSATSLQGNAFDLRIEAARIAEIGTGLKPRAGERVLQARGGLLLPGLHDQHIHLRAYAASLSSLDCGTDRLEDAQGLEQALRAVDRALPTGDWIRAVGYHESIAGEIDRHWLDRVLVDRPLRLQHRSGRLWIFNSAGLRVLGQCDGTPGQGPFERDDQGQLSGRLFDADHWLTKQLPRNRRYSLAAVSRRLAAQGITGLTDATPRNGPDEQRAFARAQAEGELLQTLRLMGSKQLDQAGDVGRVQRGATKFHLHEASLPPFDWLCEAIRRSHAAKRECAFHCVTRAELAFVVAALQEAGCQPGKDRIEHGGIIPPEWLAPIHDLGLQVVSQPHFIAERGDAYRKQVTLEDQPWLYRLNGLLQAGIPLAFGSDAPFGGANPWASMQAAVERRSRSGHRLAAHEGLSPEQALRGWLSPLEAPGAAARSLRAGGPADLCLLHEPWQALRRQLDQVTPRMTWIQGRVIEPQANQHSCSSRPARAFASCHDPEEETV